MTAEPFNIRGKRLCIYYAYVCIMLYVYEEHREPMFGSILQVSNTTLHHLCRALPLNQRDYGHEHPTSRNKLWWCAPHNLPVLFEGWHWSLHRHLRSLRKTRDINEFKPEADSFAFKGKGLMARGSSNYEERYLVLSLLVRCCYRCFSFVAWPLCCARDASCKGYLLEAWGLWSLRVRG